MYQQLLEPSVIDLCLSWWGSDIDMGIETDDVYRSPPQAVQEHSCHLSFNKRDEWRVARLSIPRVAALPLCSPLPYRPCCCLNRQCRCLTIPAAALPHHCLTVPAVPAIYNTFTFVMFTSEGTGDSARIVVSLQVHKLRATYHTHGLPWDGCSTIVNITYEDCQVVSLPSFKVNSEYLRSLSEMFIVIKCIGQ